MSSPGMDGRAVDRQTMDVDIVCVGFGPATAGFLTTLSRQLVNPDGTPAIESPSNPGLPLQVMCYERADDVSFGVSGVVTRARGIRASLPDLDPSLIPMAVTVKQEKVAYLLDPNDASRRSATVHFGDGLIRSLGLAKDHAVELPYIPPFLHKEGGLVMSLGQFLQHVGTELMSSGAVQVWPGMPVREALIENERVAGIRLTDQGVDKEGNPEAGFLPGMDVRAALTVVGDGPVGAGGRGGAPAGIGFRPARRPPPARGGGGHEDGGGSARGFHARTRHGLPHLRLSGAGDLRLLLRASRARRHGGNLRPFLVR